MTIQQAALTGLGERSRRFEVSNRYWDRNQFRELRAFTIVELLVVISIIGVLIAITLPAVQYAREAARRTHCANNVRNQVLALLQFHDKQNQFPPGRAYASGSNYSWCLPALPYLEQNPLLDRFDWKKPWNDPAGNLSVANTTLSVFRCPSSVLRFDGDSDYGGVMGSNLTSVTWLGSINNGVLIDVPSPQSVRVSVGSIVDGTSHTICVAESSDRPNDSGRWISGLNCFSHDNASIGDSNAGEIYSAHRLGAYVGFVDGSIRFLTSNVDLYVVGAICTRDRGEVIDDSAL